MSKTAGNVARQGRLKRKNLLNDKPNAYVVDATWDIQEWAWA